MDVRWHESERAGTRLWCADYGGSGPPVVLLHGLAGHAREWDSTAAWLARDASRGGARRARSRAQRALARQTSTPEAFVLDAEQWIEQLGLAPAILIGQSFGGLTALRVAARAGSSVSALVVAEATPAEDPDGAAAVAELARVLARAVRQPVRDALAFFGGDSLWAQAWSSGLEQRAGGLWPAFEPDVLLTALRQANARDFWDEWAADRAVLYSSSAQRPASRATETRRMLELPAGQRG